MNDLTQILERIAVSLERLAPPLLRFADLSHSDIFIWNAQTLSLQPVNHSAPLNLKLFVGVDGSRDKLLQNTERFAQGFPANNTLLWGARGMGKSSLVNAVHNHVNMGLSVKNIANLKLIEIYRDDISSLPKLLNIVSGKTERIIIFCDDLSFDEGDSTYKALKPVLDGGLEGKPENILFYATSNRRHILSRDRIENEMSTAINVSEAVEEKVSLSDRFGLWLGFYACSQKDYLEMVSQYADVYDLGMSSDSLSKDALEWSITRGSRSGRVAWQFICELAGGLGKKLG